MNSIFDGKVRVLDISMGWAGPLVGQMFAEMGADVIKVEDTHHFDWWRGSLSMGPPEMQPIERAAVFNTANRGKRGITLDLASARGIEILKRLIEVSDILVENFSPGVMDRLGLGYESVSAINPRLIMISMPSFGSDGPECNARGYGNTVEAMAGVTGLTGYHDGDGQRYTLSNALGDPVGGLHGVFALMVAMRERERTGRGQLIELAQVESLIPFVADAIVDFQFTEKVPAARGNRHREHAPHGIYRCAGDDNWIALACETDDQWRSLADALGIDDTRFASASDRKDQRGCARRGTVARDCTTQRRRLHRASSRGGSARCAGESGVGGDGRSANPEPRIFRRDRSRRRRDASLSRRRRAHPGYSAARRYSRAAAGRA